MSLSDAEKKDIVRQFVLAAPAHELKQVIKDVRVLVADDDLVNSVLPEACEAYNIENFVPIDVPDADHKAILCDAGAVDGKYLDPRSKKKYTVDHVTLTASSPEDAPAAHGEAIESLRAGVEKKLDDYIKNHYRTGTVSVFAVSDSEIRVYLNSERSNPGSSWSGRWKSLFIACVSGTTAKVSGTIRNQIHYYEEGNVQMDTSNESSKEVTGKDADELARKIGLFVEDAESDFHVKLDELCGGLSDTSLKALRRKLPVSRQLFDFSTSGAHKLAADLGKKVAMGGK